MVRGPSFATPTPSAKKSDLVVSGRHVTKLRGDDFFAQCCSAGGVAVSRLDRSENRREPILRLVGAEKRVIALHELRPSTTKARMERASANILSVVPAAVG
eukprot:1531922-Heterocapsa_arctica.AAC.1